MCALLSLLYKAASTDLNWPQAFLLRNCPNSTSVLPYNLKYRPLGLKIGFKRNSTSKFTS